MAILYSYQFQRDSRSFVVYFVDEQYEISRAEQLAQIDHQSRRNWACNVIEVVRNADINIWPTFDLGVLGNCSFNQRLINENWIEPTVVLMYTDNRYALYLYRFYYFYLLFFFTEQNFEKFTMNFKF